MKNKRESEICRFVCRSLESNRRILILTVDQAFKVLRSIQNQSLTTGFQFRTNVKSSQAVIHGLSGRLRLMGPLIIAAGTRPKILKMALIIRALKRKEVPSIFVHCGQHYDCNLSQQFIDDLGLPEPDYSFKMRAESQGVQTAKIIMHTDRSKRGCCRKNCGNSSKRA